MQNHNRLSLSLAKLDKLAEDVARLEVSRTTKHGEKTVPSFQHEGFLLEANKKSLKWESRFFVLRDSCLLSYNSDNLSKIVEPDSCICLGKCKVQLMDRQEELNKLVGGLIDCSNKQFCIHVTTRPDKEHVLLCAPSDEERRGWVAAIKVARTVTHANMVRLAVENRVLAEEKGAGQVTLDNTTSALAIFSNREYIQKTPVAGGAEGWLRTIGFRSAEEDAGKKGKLGSMFGMFGSADLKKIKKRYCILKDSHLMLYEAGDALLKPRGVMYLVGTTVEPLSDDGTEGFRFRCSSPQCGDYIDFTASSEKRRRRWMFALKIGARVTYPDFKLLMQEHALLASAVMTPRAAAPTKPHTPTLVVDDASHNEVLFENIDVQDLELDPGAQQPYDEVGQPLLRNPMGKLVDLDGKEVQAVTPRFGVSGEQLDNFNRPLPPGAVPMFTEDLKPIGVGPDGKHYLADGTQVDETAPHFDANGHLLPLPTVQAASVIATNLNIALKVKARMSEDGADAAVDVLGRTFRDMRDETKLVNADGEFVPLQSARRLHAETGQLQDYSTAPAPDAATNDIFMLVIKMENPSDESEDLQELGCVEIDKHTTLQDVRHAITSDELQDFVFLVDMTPLLKHEEQIRLATRCLPEIVIRGKELHSTHAPAPGAMSSFANKKVSAMIEEDEKRKREQREFEEIMQRVRQGNFLKPTHGTKSPFLDN